MHGNVIVHIHTMDHRPLRNLHQHFSPTHTYIAHALRTTVIPFYFKIKLHIHFVVLL